MGTSSQLGLPAVLVEDGVEKLSTIVCLYSVERSST